MSKETKDTLLEVRKAYRFLYQYQRKILDLVDFIGKSYGLNYSGGFSRFSNASPRNGWGNLNSWAWDWLNMYFYEFKFKPLTKMGDEYTFSIILVNDTGSFLANKKDNKNARTKLSAYEDVEKSETKLVFYVGKNSFAEFWANWEINDFVLDEKGLNKIDQNKIMLYKGYLLEDFENEEKALLQLKDFEKYCAENNMAFKVIERKFD